MSKPCLSTIKTKYSELTNKEKQLAEYILNNYEDVILMSTSRLAQNADVTKSVIVRLCQTLGFSGYTEFKLMLSRELARNEQFSFTPYISKTDSTDEIFDKVFASNIKTLHDTALGIDREVLNQAVCALEGAANIYIYGVGTSAGIVTDFQYRLMQIGLNAFCFTDIGNMRVSILNIKEGDAAIGISNSGNTIATVDTLRLAGQSGAKTVCITSYPNSEIVKISDYPLVIKTDEIQYPIEAISSRIAHISVIDSIAISLSARHYDKAAERAAKTHDIINSIRY